MLSCSSLFQKKEAVYLEELEKSELRKKTLLEFSFSLVQSENQDDMEKGVAFLQGQLTFSEKNE